MTRPPCFACKTCNLKTPSLSVRLSISQLLMRANVDTGDRLNPFARLDKSRQNVIHLCTYCRDNTIGWKVISNPRKYGPSAAARALKRWSSRLKTEVKSSINHICFICSTMEKGAETEIQNSTEDRRPKRSPTVDWTLFNVCGASKETREIFTDEFKRLSDCSAVTNGTLLNNPSGHRLCYLHLNYSRYSQHKVKELDKSSLGSQRGLCIFRGTGCSGECRRLRKLPVVDSGNIDKIAKYLRLDENILLQSDNTLNADQVMRKYACTGCRYSITDGQREYIPNVSFASIESSLDIWLLRCVLYALEVDVSKNDIALFKREDIRGLTNIASSLRQSSVVSDTYPPVRMLRFPDVSRGRKALLAAYEHQSSY